MFCRYIVIYILETNIERYGRETGQWGGGEEEGGEMFSKHFNL
jgi:hypothetical protein